MREQWRELDARLEAARRQIGDAPKELLARDVAMFRDTVNLWLNGQLLNAEFPMTLDVFVVGFTEEVRQTLATHLQGLGLRSNHAPDNRVAYSTLQLYHTQAILFDGRNPSPGAFVRLVTQRQPHIKSIVVADPNDRQLFERMRSADVAAFIPLATADTWSERIRPFDQCVLATLARPTRQCPNFAAGRPCLGECALSEGPAIAPSAISRP
jgi:hypothetical protein